MTLEEGQVRQQMACGVNPVTLHQACATWFVSLTLFPHTTKSDMTAAQSKNSEIHRD
jgi:hypothetical protein